MFSVADQGLLLSCIQYPTVAGATINCANCIRAHNFKLTKALHRRGKRGCWGCWNTPNYITGGAEHPQLKAVLCNSRHMNFQKPVNHDRNTLIEQSP